MKRVRPVMLGALLVPLVALAAPAAAPPLDPPSYIAASTRITVTPTRTIRYGPSSRQQVDLYLPRGRGPFPVAILIHGGCWSAELPKVGAIPGREHMNAVTADLLRRGVAVWNIGYRRVGEDGAAFPGTFEDVATAIDAIRDNGARLDLKRVVIVGHSAGGHLALWATARGRLPAGSPLRYGLAFLPRATVALAPWADLEASRQFVGDGCVGTDPIGPLIGYGTRPDPYADSSPMRLAPLGVRQLVVTGGHDQPELNEAARLYVERARASGDDATLLHIAESGHFEMASPWTPAWPQVRAAVLGLLRR